jgi:glucokinase
VTVYLGADIGGTKIAVVLGTAQAEVIASSRFPTTSFAGPYQALDGIERACRQLLEANRLPVEDVARIGISCGGPLDSRRGLVLSPPNLPGWDEIPVCEVLNRKLGRPVRLENDANAAAQAEWAFGAGRGTRHMVFLTCSTGMGAGLILDGRLYHGARDLAGEAGHIRLTDDGPVGYRKAGSFEGWASGAGLFDLTGRPAEEIGREALAGDPEALALIEHTGEMLGRGIAIMCDILNPELVVCGTMAVKLGDLLLAPARRVLAQEALDPCPVVPAALGADFGNVAALTVAIFEE